jgi:hypothetical protein
MNYRLLSPMEMRPSNTHPLIRNYLPLLLGAVNQQHLDLAYESSADLNKITHNFETT